MQPALRQKHQRHRWTSRDADQLRRTTTALQAAGGGLEDARAAASTAEGARQAACAQAAAAQAAVDGLQEERDALQAAVARLEEQRGAGVHQAAADAKECASLRCRVSALQVRAPMRIHPL